MSPSPSAASPPNPGAPAPSNRRCKTRPATAESFRAAAEAELAPAVPLSGNGFKIELAKRTITAVLTGLAGATP